MLRTSTSIHAMLSGMTVISALSLAPSGAWAQSATPLPPVQVERAEEPATLGTTTLDGGAIAEKRGFTADTAQLLKDIPGLNLSTGGGFSSLPSIHGMADGPVEDRSQRHGDHCRLPQSHESQHVLH